MSDSIQRFLFAESDVRGEIVQLEQSYQKTLSHHGYPGVVAKLLGEFLAAAALLSETIKFEGVLTLQARSDGEIPLIMAEANSRKELRAIARMADSAKSDSFASLLGGGQLSITIEPARGERYQGIVSLNGSNLAECLEQYFTQSEQLSTKLWLFSDGQRAGGLLLQQLPVAAEDDLEQRQDNWQHLVHLAQTTTASELLTLDAPLLLHRLFHQEALQLFEPAGLSFRCSCSRERTLSAIRALGRPEALAIVQSQGSIDVNCEFCHQHYHFSAADVDSIFTQTLH